MKQPDVCERWLDVVNFAADMGEKPFLTRIEKINPLGTFEPGNCQWVKHREEGHGFRGTVEYAAWSAMWTGYVIVNVIAPIGM